MKSSFALVVMILLSAVTFSANQSVAYPGAKARDLVNAGKAKYARQAVEMKIRGYCTQSESSYGLHVVQHESLYGYTRDVRPAIDGTCPEGAVIAFHHATRHRATDHQGRYCTFSGPYECVVPERRFAVVVQQNQESVELKTSSLKSQDIQYLEERLMAAETHPVLLTVDLANRALVSSVAADVQFVY